MRFLWVVCVLLNLLKAQNATDQLIRIKLTRHSNNKTRLIGGPARQWNSLNRWVEPLHNAGNLFYFGKVLVGTPGQLVTVDFDTGSDMFWVACKCGLGAKSIPGLGPNYCNSHQRILNPDASKTAHVFTKQFTITYGSGFVGGLKMSDRVCIPGTRHCSGNKQLMGCAIYTDSSFHNQPGSPSADGLMGLAYGNGRMGKSPMRSIFNQAGCAQKVFGFHFTNEPTNNELTICGTDPAHYIGPLNWITIVNGYFWTLTLDRVKIAGKTVFSATRLNAAILDTGTSLMYIPNSLYNAIVDRCGQCSCPDLVMTLSGKDFVLPGGYFMQKCQLMVQPGGSSSGVASPNWILGDVFLRRFYVAYDYLHRRVGLAPRKN